MTTTATTPTAPTSSSATTSSSGVASDPELDPVFLLADTDPQAMKAMNADLVAAFRSCRGELAGDFAGVPLLLLTTLGARRGQRCTTPVNYTRTQAGHYVVIASKSGSPRHPDW